MIRLKYAITSWMLPGHLMAYPDQVVCRALKSLLRLQRYDDLATLIKSSGKLPTITTIQAIGAALCSEPDRFAEFKSV